ncbi:rRNA biogenesis protein RRP5 isoform X2 [Lycium barbarum]|uniref:rRNA biogenesis protein RRP5 isoform X2 n=1 Tax=Lycium barbarum TaxID=112863 RepID=UPI00293F39BC|nr:rRNA biogenesis protein RRP5 isoform X2 [Lycium barbarum]
MAPPKSQSKKVSKPALRNVDKGKSKDKISIEDEVPDFPRGGGSSLSREELDEVRGEVDAEFEAEERLLKKRKKQKRTSTSSTTQDDDLGSLFGGGINGKLPRFPNRITLKNICPGMKLWGVVSEVNEKDIVVSLPGGLRGLVRPSEALPPFLHHQPKLLETDTNFLSSVYHVGQLVSCIVLHLDDDKKESGKRKIWLSLRLALLHKNLTLDVIQEGMILSAYVKSMEDHGYIIHFGLPSFSGFMPKESENVEVKIRSGQLVQGVVKSIDRTRKVVYLSSDPDAVSKCVTKDLKGISIDLLVPGMMVNASVRSILENGIMLSFLTYFTGTADMFNLQQTFPSSNWKVDYPQNKKVNARILFIDPSTRAVGLTLNPHLVHNKAPPTLIKVGDIFDQSKVIRIDRGLGLLLEIPSSPVPTPAYVNVSDVADKEVKKLEKNFKEGKLVRARVLGFRHLEGLATGVLKTSAFEGSVFTHSDVRPGMVVKAKVIAVDSFGAIVQFSSGVKALCPLRHMSEFEIVKPRKKFQVGAELVFRILGCKSKRITVTHKKTLVKSKLEILGSYTDATEGLTTHGWITKIENHGCFVRFYNGVQGFAPRSELGLDPGCEISSMYHIEQVVKCRVTSSNPASRRINLSFTTTPSSNELVKPGIVVSGVVERVTPHGIVLDVTAQGHFKGSISPQHLADHCGHAELMKSALRPGYEFDQLLVLDVEGSNLVLSAKHSLVASAQQLPLDVNQVHLNSVLHGYICNIIESGIFIRYLGRLTGFSPRNRATDDRRSSLSEVYQIGQSVRTNVVDVNSETSRITVSLKQSLCSSTDASFIQEYFLVEEKIAKLQLVDSGGSDLRWVEQFNLGSTVKGKVHEIKEFGVVVSFQKYDDVFGFISHYQLSGISVETGSSICTAVLDVSKIERLVDLSLKPAFVNKSKKETTNNQAQKKRKREALGELEVNQTVNAIVEIVKENYLVVSLPSYNNTLGYASRADYNTQNLPHKSVANGESVIATVMALPSPSTSGRLLLLLKSISEASETSSSKRAKRKSSYNVGSLVQAEITEIRPLELRLKFGSSFHGRVHITEVSDDNYAEAPLSNFRFGQSLTARIISKFNMSESVKRGYQWELCIKPSTLAGEMITWPRSGEIEPVKNLSYSTGQLVSGFVYKVDNEWAWLTISRDVKAQIYILDSSSEPNELDEFQKRFSVGRAFSGYVLSCNKEKKLVRLIPHPLLVDPERPACQRDGLTDHSSESMAFHIREGSVLGGRISKILPGVGGLLVQIDPHLYGKVHFTELGDPGVADPLSGYHEGQFVKCKVLEITHSGKGTVHIDLSLRSISDRTQKQELSALNDTVDFAVLMEKIEDLQPNTMVQAYVKNVTPKGCFVMLSRKVDAKVLLSNLSDRYVENPEKEFPVGKLVIGKVVSVEPLSKRVEVTLRTSNAVGASKSDKDALNNLTVGDVISGRVKRVEPYGLFITVDHTNMVGLCHVSEISDNHVDNIDSIHKAGDRVRAKILKVDKERHRISLGMKNSYFNDATSGEIDTKLSSGDALSIGIESTPSPERSSQGRENLDGESVDGKDLFLAEVESRASIPPLEVPLDDTENLDMGDVINQDSGDATNLDTSDDKNKKHAAKKAKRLREQEIIAAEERLLEKDIPRDEDEFEKLVRSSPNSSFVWIKYMAFVLSLADVEKARSIAERALRTINVREELEKLNVWVAYFNLENEYGNPPEEAVAKVFQRALQYCDPKKVHLALLGMYERTEQHKLTDELLNKMVKKFKHSCKVWLRRVQWLLKQSQDGIQSVVNRALLSLPPHKHINFITQTAILEFKCGVPDRGRSLFEKMLREYPKRTDLWSVYLDQEIRLGDADVIRALFERAITLSLPPKKMKFLFKKYLEYEKTLGDDERMEAVKRKAMEYVESSLA